MYIYYFQGAPTRSCVHENKMKMKLLFVKVKILFRKFQGNSCRKKHQGNSCRYKHQGNSCRNKQRTCRSKQNKTCRNQNEHAVSQISKNMQNSKLVIKVDYKTFKTINETFTLWKANCEKTKREQMALFRKIEKHAAKLNKKEKRKFLNDAELFTEEFELKLSFPFTKLDELTAHYDQLSWEQENNKKRLSLYEVNLFSLFYLTRFLGQEIQPKKKSKNY